MSDPEVESHVNVLVLGAGPTGLGAATRLDFISNSWQELVATDSLGAFPGCRSSPPSWTVLDERREAGGLASTDVTKEGFLFDVGGHVIFSHYTYFDDLLQSVLGDFETSPAWTAHERVSYVRYKAQWVAYPFQNNLSRLPVEDQIIAINGMVEARVLASQLTKPPRNFDEWIVRTMGEGLADLFMRPYNYKVWAVPPRLMQWGWLGERVAVVDSARAIENVLRNKEDKSWGPNATFRFPTRGGTGAIWTAVAAALPRERLVFNARVQRVDLDAKVVTYEILSSSSESDPVVVSRHRVKYDKLVSTIPLDELLARSASTHELPETRQRLMHSSTHVVGLGVRGVNPHDKKCWLYFPEDNCPFYRATVFSLYGRGNTPEPATALPTLRTARDPTAAGTEAAPGPYWSLMLEISENPEHKPVDIESVLEDTIRGCVNAGLLRGEDEIVSVYHKRFEKGYPTPSLRRDEALRDALPWLKARDVWSRGRFGSYKYEVANQDHSCAIGVEAVDNLLWNLEETTLYRPSYVNRKVGSEKNSEPSFRGLPPVEKRRGAMPSIEMGPWFWVDRERFPTNLAPLQGRWFANVGEYAGYLSDLSSAAAASAR